MVDVAGVGSDGRLQARWRGTDGSYDHLADNIYRDKENAGHHSDSTVARRVVCTAEAVNVG